MSKLIINTITPQSGDTVTVSNKLNVQGLLTYEDVTNVDSVGIITARGGMVSEGTINITGSNNGVVSAGVVTATTFDGSGASLTSLPAAQLTGTLPALSGANLTNLPSGQLTGALPAIDGSALTNLPGGTSDKIEEGNTKAEVVDTGSDGHFKVETEGTERLRIDADGLCLIGSGGSTVYANANADDLVVGNISSGKRSGITIVGATNQDARLAFSKGTSYFDALAGYIVYEFSSNKMSFYVNMSETLAIDANGRHLVGFNGLSSQVSEAKLQVFAGDSANHIAIINSAASDSDGARGGVLRFHGKNSGNSLKTLAFIEASHDGSANDEKGRLVFKTNDGSDGDAPTERLRITSSGEIGLAGANYGTAGQVLTSNGSGSAVSWASVAGFSTDAQVKTNGQTATLNIGSAQDHKVTCTGTVTIDAEGGNPDDNEGQSHTIRIINNGSATVGFSTFFLFPSGAAPSLPTVDGAISLISFTVNRVGAGGTQLLAGASVNYS